MSETHEYGKEPSMMEQRDAIEIDNAKLRSELEAERGKYKELAKSVVKLHDNHPNAFAELIERLEDELRRTE